MYLKDKKIKYTIRLTEEQMEHLELIEQLSGINKADIIRGYIDRSIGAKKLRERNKQAN